MKGVNEGGGKNHNNLQEHDDTVLLAVNEKELSELTSKIHEVWKQFGWKLISRRPRQWLSARNQIHENKYQGRIQRGGPRGPDPPFSLQPFKPKKIIIIKIK